ncbi:ATP-dependent metallopeptidase FtsH/Yme1/Tma family protein [Actinomadura sp. KC216]|uniref:ATP-dependent zinc metalloprotease FtsH n=1 Tax=Actinomadura sp. KC216 TaxID=2530370 RepID=UPI00104B0A66|nr:ATP-dependent zinc metalloprotease FtsH [Actinomadura sp. KC216]TDB83048.1 ATP-dependent metallopeptidase FtsH/Yme1/Tma family protein [Actinomadura sp. KC216]
MNIAAALRRAGRHLAGPVTTAPHGEPGRTGRPPAPASPPGLRPVRLLLTAVLIFMVLFFGPDLLDHATTEHIPYSGLLTKVEAHQVSSVAVGSSGTVTGTLTNGRHFTTQAPLWALTTGDLATHLESSEVKVSAYQQSDTLRQLVTSLLPTALFLGGFVWLGRRMQRNLGGSGGLGGLLRTKTRVTDAERPATRFADVAGYEGVKQEIREVVDYLQRPERYQRAGARGPRGVLLMGPPGTGKTLLARAVAGEAHVPFFAIEGSAFVEMFVGLGASRVRDLFTQARQAAPAIIFIDEIDAIGARRSLAGPGGHDEREQTLNQLLAEMDGFPGDTSVVVMANTNRPEALDPALMRPGRFDRQIQVPLPGLADRERILIVHAQGKHLAAGVDLSLVARATPGFSGADLANLVNEAALRAARHDRDELRPADFDAARDRLVLGQRDESNALLPAEKRAVAVHESGHALVAALSPGADRVAKVTILPTGMALGSTHQLPEDDRHLYNQDYLTGSLAVRLGGRAAELLAFGQASTGAADDLAGATRLAVRMVREYGLSPRVGPVAYPVPAARYLGAEAPDRPYAEATQRLIDHEVARLLRDAEQHAIDLLRHHRPALDALTQRLLDEETVDGQTVYDIAEQTPTAPSAITGPTPAA